MHCPATSSGFFYNFKDNHLRQKSVELGETIGNRQNLQSSLKNVFRPKEDRLNLPHNVKTLTFYRFA